MTTRTSIYTWSAIAGVSGAAGLVVAVSISEESWSYGSAGANVAIGLFLIGAIAVAAIIVEGALQMISQASSSEMARNAVEAVKNVAADARRPKITSTSGMSTADELEKWARLRDTGVVSEDEFQAARAELLKEPRS